VPEISNEALEYLQKVRKSMGIYTFGEVKSQKSKVKSEQNIRFIDGGFIAQTADDNIEQSFKDWKVVTKVKPAKKQKEQMKIAWKFISKIKSNAIIVVDKNLPMTRGIGTGQTSRIRSTRIALEQAGKYAKGAILASDGFFPFDDSVKMAVDAGISAIVQQGGSVNDKLSIAAADKAGIPMVITRRRAFWH
ncbi:MAG: bifunctional phosphoribosylaminoimidazolecarboxamide formyltransferase/IMP cyclohydrolase, partial [bacterium]|nr:bifunctional phosphoribosylaminoimidazolecarboxamide formyltransferase/IMP cyclohydrolase [bacterium]